MKKPGMIYRVNRMEINGVHITDERCAAWAAASSLLTGCDDSLWRRRSTLRWKARGQRSHANGLYPECLRVCVMRFDDWLNALPHTTHLCGFSPVHRKVTVKLRCLNNVKCLRYPCECRCAFSCPTFDGIACHSSCTERDACPSEWASESTALSFAWTFFHTGYTQIDENHFARRTVSASYRNRSTFWSLPPLLLVLSVSMKTTRA